MGPDEYATREELGVFVKLLFAKIDKQAKTISALVELLGANGTLPLKAISELLAAVQASESSQKVTRCVADLRQLEASHNILRTLGLLPEDL